MDNLISEISSFIQEREWEKFHNGKDVAIALSIEANELLESFLWKSTEEVNIEKIKEELADVFIYALDMARIYNLDVYQIIQNKINLNSIKYPINDVKGKNIKYTELL